MVNLVSLAAISTKHGLPVPATVPEPWIGAASAVYPVGNVVVKIPFDRPDTVEAVRIDATIAPIARQLGVSVPEMIAFDDSLETIAVPYAVFRRVIGGAPLDRTGRAGTDQTAWRQVGRQLALIHSVTSAADVPIELRTFRQSAEVDPRPWVDEMHASGVLGSEDARWLRELLDHIAPVALADVPLALCHGDTNAANVLVDERDSRFLALIDWAGSGWLDPAWDFAGVPLDVVPWMLDGHREIAPLPDDVTAEARVCWCQVQTRLFSVRRAASSEKGREQVRRHVEQVRRFTDVTGSLFLP